MWMLSAYLGHEPSPIGRFTCLLAGWHDVKHGYLNAEREWQAQNPAWKTAMHGRQLTYDDLQRALEDATDTRRELYLRRRIWRATNDHVRRTGDGKCATIQPIAPEADRRANMVRLIVLHEAAGTHIVERAELLRQLGRFDDEILLLKSGAPEIRRSENAAWILRWARTGDADVKAFT